MHHCREALGFGRTTCKVEIELVRLLSGSSQQGCLLRENHQPVYRSTTPQISTKTRLELVYGVLAENVAADKRRRRCDPCLAGVGHLEPPPWYAQEWVTQMLTTLDWFPQQQLVPKIVQQHTTQHTEVDTVREKLGG